MVGTTAPNIGIELGIGFGVTIPVIVVLVVVVVVVVVMYRRIKATANQDKSTSSQSRTQQQAAYEDVDPTAPVDRSTYASLDNTARTQDYAQLKLYESTKNGAHSHHHNGDQSAVSQSKPYEDVSLHTYANTNSQTGDPAYANTNSLD